MSIPNLTDDQKNLLFFGDNANGGLASTLDALIDGVNARPRVALVPGTNGAEINDPGDVGTVIAILAITTATGAAAAQLLLTPATDFTVAAGKVTCVGDKSALTLLIVYLPA